MSSVPWLKQHPGELSRLPDGAATRWREILVCTHEAIGKKHLSLLSAGLAMYALLAVFPGLAAVVFVYGLFATPADVMQHMELLARVLPQGTWALFSGPLQDIASDRGGSVH